MVSSSWLSLLELLCECQTPVPLAQAQASGAAGEEAELCCMYAFLRGSGAGLQQRRPAAANSAPLALELDTTCNRTPPQLAPVCQPRRRGTCAAPLLPISRPPTRPDPLQLWTASAVQPRTGGSGPPSTPPPGRPLHDALQLLGVHQRVVDQLQRGQLLGGRGPALLLEHDALALHRPAVLQGRRGAASGGGAQGVG